MAELPPGVVAAIDGKTARRSYDRAGQKGAIPRVSARATQQSRTLGQVKTDEKSTEITAIPQLVVGHRQTHAGGISPPRYHISSRAAPAEQLLAAIRSHWRSENSRRWTLDLSFREDLCRVGKDNGPQHINPLRQIGHNLLQNEQTRKVGSQGKRRNAGWDENYLLKVLLG